MPVTLADLSVYSRKGRFVGAVEVKNHHDLSVAQATAIRRYMVEEDRLPESDYLFVTSQEIAHVWKDQISAPADRPPSVSFPMNDVIERYAIASSENEWFSRSYLEAVLRSWLSELTYRAPDMSAASESALNEIGFMDAIKGGTWMLETL